MSDTDNNPVERLSDQILADARRKAGRTQKKADREAEKLLADARKQADAIVERALADARDRADRDCRMLLASLPLEVLRHRLGCQQEALEQVRAQAEAEACALDGEQRHGVLVRLTRQAVEAIGAEACVVALGESDRGQFGQRLTDEVARQTGCELQLDPATPTIRGGVIVRSADGRRRYDNSVEARFTRHWEELRTDVATMVFAPADQPPTGGTGDHAGH